VGYGKAGTSSGRLIGLGLSNEEIDGLLFIAESTA
jgi:hypothetical protein